jgi:hypothetical protein
MSDSLRDRIAKANDTRVEKVHVPEWDITFEVRSMTGGERARMMEEAVNPKTEQVDLQKMYPDVVIACTYDPETGEQVFRPSDRSMLMTKNAAAVDKLAMAGIRLSGLMEEAVTERVAAFQVDEPGQGHEVPSGTGGDVAPDGG